MSISRDQYRVLGQTRLTVPPIVFGTAALGNVGRVMTDQAKFALCGEFLNQVAPPVWIETSYGHGDGKALEVLGRALRRLDVSSDEVVIQLTINSLGAQSITECWEGSCRLLGDEFRPKLVAIENVDETNLRFTAELKSAGQVVGVGLAVGDWRRANSARAFDPDWKMFGGCTVMRHPPEVLGFLSMQAMNRIPVVLSGVFEGGFLVGDNRLDGHTLSAEDSSNRSHLAWRKAFVALCDGHGISPAHACIEFALSAPGVAAVRLETSYADRVAENVQAVCQKAPENFWQSMKEEGLLP